MPLLMIGPIELLILFVVFISVYFIPTMVAVIRGHPQTLPILVLNILAGWTFFGWVGALVWSLVRFTPARSGNY